MKMKFKTINVEPGSDAWLEIRLDHLTASEAAAMMGDSPYMSRNQLLALKKGWQSNPNSEFKERLFADGHRFEAEARPLVEMEYLEDFPPVVAGLSVQGLELLASFDGLALTLNPILVWEHKSWNEILAENTRNGLVEAVHYWQLEQQMLIAGVKECLFTVSDGTASKKVECIYKSVPKRRKDLIAGWIQFEKDLKEFKLEARSELIEAPKAKGLPLVTYEVNGSEISSNINACLDQIRDRAQIEMTRVLETDQDFAEKEDLNKATKQARADLDSLVGKVRGHFTSFSDFARVAGEIDSVLQKMQSHGEKLVKTAKDEKKIAIGADAEKRLLKHLATINKRIAPVDIIAVSSVRADWPGVMKNKRTLESLQNAVDTELARVKKEIEAIVEVIVKNQVSFNELAKGYELLFADTNQLITKDNDGFIAIIKQRIADHKLAEEETRQREEKERAERAAKASKAETDREEAKTIMADGQKKASEKKQTGTISFPNEMPKSLEDFPPSLTTSLVIWQADNEISEQAMNRLFDVLERHGVRVARQMIDNAI